MLSCLTRKNLELLIICDLLAGVYIFRSLVQCVHLFVYDLTINPIFLKIKKKKREREREATVITLNIGTGRLLQTV